MVNQVRRHDPHFKPFHAMLEAKGKPHKVIRIALRGNR